ncbi:glycerate kinase-like [Tropilaelaps mercedesae]|uniref:Glycerate kinase-like n=1 Tax=Tropilaelaps mercedesae TaxID=418985 RepID=A0A1V9X620_9ACAR|nr:glycerate kinase-like [Tropilaelaps mercedesae]
MSKENIVRLSTAARFHRDVRRIFRAAVYAVEPQALMRRKVHVINDKLHFKVGSLDATSRVYEPNHNIYVCGMGKAVAPMAAQLQNLLWPHIQQGIISIPVGFTHLAQLLKKPWLPKYPIEVLEGAKGNIPDEASLSASQKIIAMIEPLSETDILFVLISGGGSALAPLPKTPLTLPEKQALIHKLSSSGASIEEINTVRTRLSALKGGKLLARTRARVISLILSDIIGSPLHLIASGPTVLPLTKGDTEEAIEILRKYNIDVSTHLAEIMNRSSSISIPTAKVENHIIGSNVVALEAAKQEALSLGYHVVVATDRLIGEARNVGQGIAKIATHGDTFDLNVSEEVRQQLKNLPHDSVICVLFGGETTVKVTGSGVGGRNQELALSAAIALNGHRRDVVLLSAGTDGIDGPTDAAGAVVDQKTISLYKRLCVAENKTDASSYLANNDSYNFFKGIHDAHFKIGHTGTNVMDIQVLLFETTTNDSSNTS